MPEWITWFFDGFGTQIICLLIGVLIGGVGGFRIGKNKEKMKQKQATGSNSLQFQKGIQKERQEGKDENSSSEQKRIDLHQRQKAGDNSIQIQSGEQNDD